MATLASFDPTPENIDAYLELQRQEFENRRNSGWWHYSIEESPMIGILLMVVGFGGPFLGLLESWPKYVFRVQSPDTFIQDEKEEVDLGSLIKGLMSD